MIKTISKKKCKKAKWLSEEALQIAEKRREVKSKGEKENTHLNAEFQRIARRDKKAFLNEECGRPGFDPLVGKIPLEEGMATHSSTLAWRILWTEEPGGLQSMGSQRVRHD